MSCKKCGGELQPESRFCPSCGEGIESPQTERPSVAKSKKRMGLYAGIAGLCVVAILAIALAMLARGNMVADTSAVQYPGHAPVIQAPELPSGAQPDVLQTDVEKPPLSLERPEKTEPPVEVVAYLEHLKHVETMRQTVTANALNDLVATAPDLISRAFPMDQDWEESSAPRELTSQAGRYSQEWQQIAAYFVSVQAPEQCAPLAGKYYDALREFIVFMGRFQDATSKLDVAALQQIKQEQVSVDEKLNSADRELAQVCRTYGIEKSFAIRSDTGQTPLLGF